MNTNAHVGMTMTTSNMYMNTNVFPDPTSNTKAKIDVFPVKHNTNVLTTKTVVISIL